jgi:hypothetical protein
MKGPQTLTCLIAAMAMSLGCSSVRSTSVATGAAGQAVDPSRVAIAATFVPPGATQVAVVETHGNLGEGLDAVLLGFRTEVGARGGDFGKVDSMRTRFEMQTVTSMQSYACGSPSAPQTCSRMVTQQVEVGILTVVGRAFRLGGTQ